MMIAATIPDTANTARVRAFVLIVPIAIAIAKKAIIEAITATNGPLPQANQMPAI